MKKIVIALAFTTLMLSSVNCFGQSQSREDLLKQIAAKRAELAKLEKAFLSPSEEHLAVYADFLRQPNTGLIRLLPREIYDNGNSGNKIGVTMRGGGAFYSFKDRTHEYINSTDLSLERGYLSTGFAGANYGMLASLGDVALESVGLDGSAALAFAQHTPAPDEPHARIEQRRTSEGASLNGINYKNRLIRQLNSTYLLRSVNYSASDLLVAFRVVRIEDDDSLIILWKLLKKYPTPYLARN